MTLRFRGFTLDTARRLLLDGDDEVHLTPKAYELLRVLAEAAPRVVSKDELHNRLWPGTFVSDATLAGLVKELRRLLKDRDSKAPLIRTSHGIGFSLAAAIETDAPAAPTSWIVAGTRQIALSEGTHIIGRDPAAAIVLDAPGVSRHHARIVVTREGALLEDLGSKNGTRIADAEVTGAVELQDRDRIQLGPAHIVYYVSAASMSTETVVAPARR